MFLERQIQGIPAIFDWIWLVGIIIGAIGIYKWWTTRKDYVKKSAYNEVVEKLRKAEEKNADSSAYYPADMQELLTWLGRLFNQPEPASLKDATILVRGNVIHFEALLGSLIKSCENIRKDAKRQNFKSVLQILDALTTSYTMHKGVNEIAGTENSIVKRNASLILEDNTRKDKHITVLQQELRDTDESHSELRHMVIQLMKDFENFDGRNPLALELEKTKGANEAYEKAGAQLERILEMLRPVQGGKGGGNNNTQQPRTVN